MLIRFVCAIVLLPDISGSSGHHVKTKTSKYREHERYLGDAMFLRYSHNALRVSARQMDNLNFLR